MDRPPPDGDPGSRDLVLTLAGRRELLVQLLLTDGGGGRHGTVIETAATYAAVARAKIKDWDAALELARGAAATIAGSSRLPDGEMVRVMRKKLTSVIDVAEKMREATVGCSRRLLETRGVVKCLIVWRPTHWRRAVAASERGIEKQVEALMSPGWSRATAAARHR